MTSRSLGGGGTGTHARNHIGRLIPDGSLDAGFNPGANGIVRALAVQPDGKILVGGAIHDAGRRRDRHDAAQLPRAAATPTARSTRASTRARTVASCQALAVQPDGKILVGGSFTMLGGGGTGTTRAATLGRLNADGSLDTAFNPGAKRTVDTMALQPDGKILVGGDFTTLGGGGTGTTPRNRIGRLNADGSLDATFNPGANDSV